MSPTAPDARSVPLPLAADPEWHKSACILCECNCGLEIQVEGRRLARIRGDKAHPASAGYTCEKPLRLDRYQNGRDRITSPLRRTADGSYEEIDWDTAITEIAAKLEAIRTEHGGEKIFFYAGGGQGNHFPGAYGQSLRAALGTRYYSNALAQEKTGEMWVDGRLYGGHTKGDFEHSEVVLFLGKNPWQSHSFPRTRPTLREIAADPGRAMIVIDPRRTETADLADFHLQVRPGTDAWCLAAMLGVLVQEDLVDHAFIAEHTTGVEQVLPVLAEVPVTEYAERCGVPEDMIRAATRRFAAAASATTYEDLGTQQAPNSTLVSYLNKLLWILTGNFGRPGTMYLHSSFVAIAGTGSPSSPSSKRARSRLRTTASRLTAKAVSLGAGGVSRATVQATRTPIPDALLNRLARAAVDQLAPLLSGSLSTGVSPKGNRVTPVTGARIIGGLIPCTSIADEILTDHPGRFRAMWIDSSNPAHSLPDSARFSEALRALDLVVVVDVAFTETARLADYVLPAATQFEKWEATFFNFEFPDNVFQLRAPVLDPLPGTLPEAEIYARVLRALGAVDPDVLGRLRAAAVSGRDTFALAFFSSAAADPSLLKLAAYVLYETLGQTLPDNAAAAAFLWGASHRCALSNPDGVAGAGYDGPGLRPGEQLFEAVLSTRSGVTFTSDTWDGVWKYVRGRDRRFTVAIPSLLEDLAGLGEGPSAWTTEEFPFVLAAGERRAFTANTIIRDPDWRRRDRDGALRISPGDAESLGLQPGGRVRVVTETGSAETSVEITDTLQPGHVTLPNGLGVDHPQVDGSRALTGVPLNRLTSTRYRDAVAGTPWHKYVPARLEPLE